MCFGGCPSRRVAVRSTRWWARRAAASRPCFIYSDCSIVRMRAKFGSTVFVFQFHFLMLEFTALENVMMPMRKLGRLTPAEMTDRAQSLLAAVGLGSKSFRLGTHLSGGEQQRVAIARAMANQPAIILADEPTGNLDVRNSAMVFDLLTGLAKDNGQAIVLVTHNPDIAQRCDHTRPMRDGQFVS